MNKTNSLIEMNNQPYSNCQSEVLIMHEHEYFVKRRVSEMESKQIKQINRSYVLVNVMLQQIQIINMHMNPRQADKLLEQMDLNDDKNILLDRVINQMLENPDNNANPQYYDGVKFILINQIKKLGLYPQFSHQNQQQEQSVEVDTKLCKICMDLVPINEFVMIPICLEEYCKQCVSDYLKNKVIISDVMNISCPSDQCLSMLSDGFIKENLDQMFYDKYQKFLKIKILSSDPMIRWCPSDCERYVRGEPGSVRLLCVCGTSICFLCGGEFHGQLTCEQSLDEAYKQAMINFKIYQCPNCKCPIQKLDGCNHMTCSRCNYEFCWICRRKYFFNHYSRWNYFNGCPGMQNAEAEPYTYPGYKQACFIFLGLLAFPLILMILSVGLVISGFFGPMLLYMNIVTWARFTLYSKVYQAFIYLMWFILGIFLYPVTMCVFSFFILIGFIKIMHSFIQGIIQCSIWCCNSLRNWSWNS